jgi:hypothetical protein
VVDDDQDDEEEEDDEDIEGGSEQGELHNLIAYGIKSRSSECVTDLGTIKFVKFAYYG